MDYKIVDTQDQLLFDILQELKEINQKLTPVSPIAKGLECKHCGEVHENKGKALACAKKAKKEGGANVPTD